VRSNGRLYSVFLCIRSSKAELSVFLLTPWNRCTVPDVEMGCCLGSEGNGVSVGEGGKGGPGPPERGNDKQSVPNKGRDNMGKDEEDQPKRT
jgi:hypothetical protein